MKKASFLPKNTLAKLFLCAIFVVFVFLPFALMVAKIKPEDFTEIFTSKSFLPALKTSILAALAAVAISTPLGFALAFCIQRTNIPFKKTLTILLVLPMLIPSIAHGTGLIILFGNNGILREFLGIEGTIYGFWGIVIGSVLYSFPSSFLMFSDALKYEDGSPYEAAQVLGIPPIRRLTAITLPYLKKPLISVVFSVFTMVITDYGVPMRLGNAQTNTLAWMMYDKALGSNPNFGQSSVIGLLLLLPAVITFTINLLSERQSKMGYVTRAMNIKKNRIRDCFSFLFCSATLLSLFTLIAAFALKAFTIRYPSDPTPSMQNLAKIVQQGRLSNLWTSFTIAVAVALLGSLVAFCTAYLTSRMPSKLSHVLHLFSITSLAIPGIVLGLAYAGTFSGIRWFYRSVLILITVNTMHFVASPYQMMYNSLLGMNQNLEHVGATLGIGRFRIVRDVILPQSLSTLIEMFSYFFVNSMMTISAVSFLANTRNNPFALYITRYDESGFFELSAVIALVILLVNLIVKVAVFASTNAIKKRNEKLRCKIGE